MNPELREAIAQLSTSERIALAMEIWETLPAEIDAGPLTQAQREEIDRRLADYEQNPTESLSWDEIKAELRKSG
jgi:putative addiction module component (TIGR02574 family)